MFDHFVGLALKGLTKQELYEFHSIIGRLNWIANHTRPIQFDLYQLSSIVKSDTVKDLLFTNKLVCKVKSGQSALRISELVLSNLQFICYNDSSFRHLVSHSICSIEDRRLLLK